jgi:hypothetical protein
MRFAVVIFSACFNDIYLKLNWFLLLKVLIKVGNMYIELSFILNQWGF